MRRKFFPPPTVLPQSSRNTQIRILGIDLEMLVTTTNSRNTVCEAAGVVELVDTLDLGSSVFLKKIKNIKKGGVQNSSPKQRRSSRQLSADFICL